MSAPFTSYIVDNDHRFRDALTRALNVTSDFRIPFGLILKDFYRSEKAIFQLTGPGKYPPFKNSGGYYRKNKSGEKVWVGDKDGSMSRYQVAKIKKVGFDYPLLVRYGALAASLLSPTAPGAVAVVGNLSLTFGTSIPYAIYHQSDEPRSKLPLRKLLFIGPEAPRFATSDQMGRTERWVGYINDWVFQNWGKT